MSAVFICYYRLSHVEYDRAVAAAVFEVRTKLDLIDEDRHAMTPEGSRHTTDTDLLADCLRWVFGSKCQVRIEHPLADEDCSEPSQIWPL